MKLSRGWTMYTRHKICKNEKLFSISSDTFKTSGWPTWKAYLSTPLTLFAQLHGLWGLVLCMLYIQCKDESKGLEVHNLLLHTNCLQICRSVKASCLQLQLTTQTGNLQQSKFSTCWLKSPFLCLCPKFQICPFSLLECTVLHWCNQLSNNQ